MWQGRKWFSKCNNQWCPKHNYFHHMKTLTFTIERTQVPFKPNLASIMVGVEYVYLVGTYPHHNACKTPHFIYDKYDACTIMPKSTQIPSLTLRASSRESPATPEAKFQGSGRSKSSSFFIVLEIRKMIIWGMIILITVTRKRRLRTILVITIFYRDCHRHLT